MHAPPLGRSLPSTTRCTTWDGARPGKPEATWSTGSSRELSLEPLGEAQPSAAAIPPRLRVGMPTRPRKRETPAGSVSPKSQTLRAVPPEPSFTCPDGSRKKRSCLGTAEEAAETVTCLFPLEQSPVIDAAAASSSETHRSQEVFSNALEESRLSDAFLSWPVTSFAEDDETSRERLEAPWHEVLWGQSDSLMSLGHADNGEQANQVAESETPHARSIPERSAAALHTPLTRGAKVDEMNASSKVLERMPSPGHQIPSLPGIFELSNNILLSPVTSRQQLHGPKSLHSMSSPLVGSAKGTNETTLGSPDPIKHSYSMSLSSSKDSEEEDAEDNSSQSPHTPSSMKIVLGHPMQSQSVFESINNKLKRTPQQRRPATPRTREAPQPPRPQCTNYPTSHHPGMYPPHQPMQYDGYVPLYHGYPTQPRPADVAISYRRERPCSRPVTAIHTKIVSSTTKESIPAATERKSIVVSAEKMGKENGPKQRNSKEMQVSCNCKKSRCLKLYCDCFSQNRFCNSCKCDDCHNTSLFKSIRDVAVMEVLSKNPQAFKPRIETKSHSMGCRCKKSRCLKKYCEVSSILIRAMPLWDDEGLIRSILVFRGSSFVYRQMQVFRMPEYSWVASPYRPTQKNWG